MSSLEQIDKDYKLEPITQPRLDVEAIEIPDKGPMNFEMDVEVRPQFELPNYKGLKVKSTDRRAYRQSMSTSSLTGSWKGTARSFPSWKGNAELGDYLTADLTFIGPDGEPLDELKEVQFRLQPELRFQDGTITGIGARLQGPARGDTREVEAKLGSAVANPELRGTTIPVKVHVNDLKRLRLSRAESVVPRLDQPRRATTISVKPCARR